MVAALMAATFGLYWQVHRFAFLPFDDPQYVSGNTMVLRGLTREGFSYAMTARVSGNWHPVTLLAEMATIQLFGSSAGTLHLLCASLHTVNVALLFLFLSFATGRKGAAAVVAAVWGLHPLRVESVAWVGEFKDVLCGLFWLGSMIAYAGWRRSGGYWKYAAFFTLVGLAMASKPMAVTLPGALLVLNLWPLNSNIRRVAWPRLIVEQLPLFVTAAAVAVVTVHTQQQDQFVGSTTSFPLDQRLANGAWSAVMYLIGQAVPTGMGLIYPHPNTLGRTVPAWHWITGAVVLMGVTTLALRTRRDRPYLISGWLWFLGTLVPVIGLVQVGLAARADRYTYLPAMGLLWAAVWGVAECGIVASRPRLAAGSAVAVIVIFSAVAYVQVGYWADARTLLGHSVRVITDDFLAMSALSIQETDAGDPTEGLRLADEAVAVAPGFTEAHHARANALRDLGHSADARAEYATALELMPGNPATRKDLGLLQYKAGRLKEAAAMFESVVRLDPDDEVAHHLAAMCEAGAGDYARAADHWRAAISIKPEWDEPHGRLGDVLRLQGDARGAIVEYSVAVRLGATYPNWIAYLTLLSAQDPAVPTERIESLLSAVSRACKETGDGAFLPRYAMSAALARLGRWDEATAAATIARDGAASAGNRPAAAEMQKAMDAYGRHQRR